MSRYDTIEREILFLLRMNGPMGLRELLAQVPADSVAVNAALAGLAAEGHVRPLNHRRRSLRYERAEPACSEYNLSGYWRGRPCGATPTIMKPDRRWVCANHTPEAIEASRVTRGKTLARRREKRAGRKVSA